MGKIATRIVGLFIGCAFNVFSYASGHSSSMSASNISYKPLTPHETKQSAALPSKQSKQCAYWLPLFKPLCHRLHQIWNEGHNDLYVSGYAWHNRFIYSEKQIQHYNELSWGGGLGKGFFDEHGNWHGLYAFAFLDSHSNVEPIAGYAYLVSGNVTKNFKAGLGFSVFITARPDICSYIPFPGAVPWAGVFYKKLSLKMSYVPGFSNNGNVLYAVGTYSFD